MKTRLAVLGLLVVSCVAVQAAEDQQARLKRFLNPTKQSWGKVTVAPDAGLVIIYVDTPKTLETSGFWNAVKRTPEDLEPIFKNRPLPDGTRRSIYLVSTSWLKPENELTEAAEKGTLPLMDRMYRFEGLVGPLGIVKLQLKDRANPEAAEAYLKAKNLKFQKKDDGRYVFLAGDLWEQCALVKDLEAQEFTNWAEPEIFRQLTNFN